MIIFVKIISILAKKNGIIGFPCEIETLEFPQSCRKCIITFFIQPFWSRIKWFVSFITSVSRYSQGSNLPHSHHWWTHLKFLEFEKIYFRSQGNRGKSFHHEIDQLIQWRCLIGVWSNLAVKRLFVGQIWASLSPYLARSETPKHFEC